MLTQKQIAERLGVSQPKISRLFKANYKELEPYFVKTGRKVRLKESALPIVAEYLNEKGYKTATDYDFELQGLKDSLNIKDKYIASIEAQIEALKDHIETLKHENAHLTDELISAKAELKAFTELSFLKRLTWKPKNS